MVIHWQYYIQNQYIEDDSALGHFSQHDLLVVYYSIYMAYNGKGLVESLSL